LIDEFLDTSVSEPEQRLRGQLQPYLDFIRGRARGEEPTPAQFMRRFIQNHGDYAQNSVMSDIICYDMLLEIADME
jgi:glutamate--cysteine ligase catalytic subunit